MKIAGFAGSPRIGGNSDLLLDEVLAGAAAAGAQVGKTHLSRLSIQGCQGCDGCERPGAGCVLKDDMPAVAARIMEADALVFATPIYWFGVSSQLKAMIDRWYGISKQVAWASKRAALVIVKGDSDPIVARPAIDMFSQACAYLKMPLFEPLVVTAADQGEVKDNGDALAKARELGKRLAE